MEKKIDNEMEAGGIIYGSKDLSLSYCIEETILLRVLYISIWVTSFKFPSSNPVSSVQNHEKIIGGPGALGIPTPRVVRKGAQHPVEGCLCATLNPTSWRLDPKTLT